MNIDRSLSDELSYELKSVLGSDLISVHYLERSELTVGPAIQVNISDSEAFSLSQVNDLWLSSDEVVSSLIEEQSWARPESPAELLLLITGISLWWLHVDVNHKEQLGPEYAETILLPTVRYWETVYAALGLNYRAGRFSYELANYWHQQSVEFGFLLGMDDESELFQALKLSWNHEFSDSPTSELANLDSPEIASVEAGTEALARDGCPVSRAERPEDWRILRRNGVTATDAMKLLRKNGKPSRQRIGLLRSKVVGDTDPYFDTYALGIEREPLIAAWLSDEVSDSEPNDVLFRGINPRHLATPDMIGIDFAIEIKVSSQPLDAIVKKYSDQVQWQIHVMGVSQGLIVLEDRHSQEISSLWIERDDARISALVEAADDFLEKLDVANTIWDSDFDIEDWDFFSQDRGPEDGRRGETQRVESGASILRSSKFQPAFVSQAKGVVFRDIDVDEEETEPDPLEDLPDVHGLEAHRFSKGNPYREIRERLGISQTDFRTKYEFGKMTMVYLETGMYTQISERQQQAIIDLSREHYFDMEEYLRREHHSDSLNEAYRNWQAEARRSEARVLLEKIKPPFPFTTEHSPLFFVIRDHFGGIQRFCKVLKVPSITVSRHLEGQTSSIPVAIVEALVESGYSETDSLLDAQSSWLRDFRSAG